MRARLREALFDLFDGVGEGGLELLTAGVREGAQRLEVGEAGRCTEFTERGERGDFFAARCGVLEQDREQDGFGGDVSDALEEARERGEVSGVGPLGRLGEGQDPARVGVLIKAREHGEADGGRSALEQGLDESGVFGGGEGGEGQREHRIERGGRGVLEQLEAQVDVRGSCRPSKRGRSRGRW